MTPWMLVTVAYAQDAENADGAQDLETPTVSSETIADPGAIPDGGFIGNDQYGAIPLGSGWGYVWAVYIATWLTLLGYGVYLALRNRKIS